MNKIKFSHAYNKLDSIAIDEPVLLLGVLKTHRNDLSKAFIKYDTCYRLWIAI